MSHSYFSVLSFTGAAKKTYNTTLEVSQRSQVGVCLQGVLLNVSTIFLNSGNYNLPPSGLILIPLVQHEHIILGDPRPALAVDVVQVDLPAAVGVTVRSLVYGAAA